MSAAHTPGPWYVSKRNPMRVIESGPRGNTIATCSSNLGVCGEDQARANAVAIASLPFLLDSLRQIAEQDSGHVGQINDMANMARAAIAKATGEQS